MEEEHGSDMIVEPGVLIHRMKSKAGSTVHGREAIDVAGELPEEASVGVPRHDGGRNDEVVFEAVAEDVFDGACEDWPDGRRNEGDGSRFQFAAREQGISKSGTTWLFQSLVLTLDSPRRDDLLSPHLPTIQPSMPLQRSPTRGC